MARYSDVPDEMKITSEALEPTLAYLIGRWYAQAQYMKETYGKESSAYCDALENFWQGLGALEKVVLLSIDAVHAQLRLGTEMQIVDRMIEAELGFSPIMKHQELESCSFRNLVAHELEFHFNAP